MLLLLILITKGSTQRDPEGTWISVKPRRFGNKKYINSIKNIDYNSDDTIKPLFPAGTRKPITRKSRLIPTFNNEKQSLLKTKNFRPLISLAPVSIVKKFVEDEFFEIYRTETSKNGGIASVLNSEAKNILKSDISIASSPTSHGHFIEIQTSYEDLIKELSSQT